MIKAPSKISTAKNIIILKQRTILFKDFSVELVKKINDTFPGSEGLNDNDVLNHYNWCFDVISNVFQKQGVYFKDNQEIRDYFLDILISSYYSIDDNKKEIATNNIIKSLISLFSTNISTSGNANLLNDIFKKFNTSIDR